MKYGESSFDIIYLLIAIISGFQILTKRKDILNRLAGLAILVLGFGDAFHLVPRVLNYFVEADFTRYLGVGKLITSLTMTGFYVLLYCFYLRAYEVKEDRKLTYVIYALALLRLVICLFPQNGWLSNESSILWGILRNIPFVILGVIIVWLYYVKRQEIQALKWLWLSVTLSFLFYIPVAVGASAIPMLGMLMLPKTICYIWLIFMLRKYLLK